MQSVKNPSFEQFLITNSNFDRIFLRTLFLKPIRNKRNIQTPSLIPRFLIKWFRSPQQTNSIRNPPIRDFLILQNTLKSFRQLKFLYFLIAQQTDLSHFSIFHLVSRNRINYRIEIKRRQLWVLLFYVDTGWVMVRDKNDFSGSAVIQMRKCYFVLCTDLLTDN
jgi:hypothetical protein